MKDASACRQQAEACARKAEETIRPEDKERWMWLSREWLKLAQDPRRQNLPPEDERGIRRVKTD